MNIFKKIKNRYQYNQQLIIKHFLSKELEDINKEIIQNREYQEILESKRDRVELLIFGG